MTHNTVLNNYINGEWCVPEAGKHLDVLNPATAELLGRVPLSSDRDVDEAARAAASAFIARRRTPFSTIPPFMPLVLSARRQ
jgi:malonate-semialdehyde dehydrogenase (acetylating)/methylmalonate-semialdehyde dehydrogenase